MAFINGIYRKLMAVSCWSAFIFAVADLRAERSPNVIVVLADDQGWGDLSCHGNRDLATPHIDSLARDGVQLTRFFVCPVCAPTRAEFLTGRYFARGGVSGVSRGAERLDLDEITIADAFHQAGYATAAFGKWHNGTQYPYHPLGRGFDAFYGFTSGHWGSYFDPLLDHNGQLVKGQGYLPDDITDRAIEFLQHHHQRGNPFFVILAYNTPHSPMQVPDRWWKRFSDKTLQMPHPFETQNESQHTRAALAMCENIDMNVGRLMTALEQQGIGDRTVVVYFSDNGPNGRRWNGGMRGIKGSTDDGGTRSPCFVRWNGRIRRGAKISSLSSAMDLFPTLVDLARVPIPEGSRRFDGTSWARVFLNKEAEPGLVDRQLFSAWGGRVSVRTNRFRLDHEGRLYEMSVDPGQITDVTATHPDVARNLASAVAGWRAEMRLDEPRESVPFAVGHPGCAMTQLPARDADLYGGVQRSNRFPNCTFITNWRSTEDRIKWPVEVLKRGRFRADLYYTCDDKDIGSEITLSFGTAHSQTTITRPFQTPLRGAELDRIPRQESYVKDFAVLPIGELTLEAESGMLILSASQVPHESVADVRMLTLTRAD